MKKISTFLASAFVAALLGVVGVSLVAYAQTSPLLGSNGMTYSYNGNTYVTPNGMTYDPTSGSYTSGSGSSYTYVASNGYYYNDGTPYTYDQSTNSFNPVALPTTTTTTTSSSPVFYMTPGGTSVYNTGAPISAGTYYLPSGQLIYYYGNGYYYDPTTATYGNINEPGFVSTTYPLSTDTAVGAPNTGAGGEAPLNWTLLIAASVIVLCGSAYLVRRSLSSVA